MSVFDKTKKYINDLWEYYKTGPGYNDYIKPVVDAYGNFYDNFYNNIPDVEIVPDDKWGQFDTFNQRNKYIYPLPVPGYGVKVTPKDNSTKDKKVNKRQQGGQMEQQDVQQQIIQLVQAAMQGDQEALQTIEQIMQAALQGDLQATQIAQIIQAVVQQMQGVQAARHGAKLNYIKSLRGKCPEGYEVGYYKAGGQVCKTCIKKQLQGDAIEQYKCGKKMKKMKKGGKEDNTQIETRKDYEMDGGQRIPVNRTQMINGTDTIYSTKYPTFPQANRLSSNKNPNRTMFESDKRDFENAPKQTLSLKKK